MGNAEFVCPGVRANVIAAGTSGARLVPPPTAGTVPPPPPIIVVLVDVDE